MEVEGYKNFATFQVAHIIMNNQEALKRMDRKIVACRDMASRKHQNLDLTYDQAIRLFLANEIEYAIGLLCVEGISVIRPFEYWKDISLGLLQAGFNEVEWNEIADVLLRRYAEIHGEA